jgi:hypothetical protein
MLSHPRRLVGLLLSIALSVAACGATVDRSPGPTGRDAADDGFSADLAWLAVHEIEENDVTVAIDAELVRSDGSVVWNGKLALNPAVPGGLVVVGPRDGVLAYGALVDGAMVLRIVRSSDGSDQEIGRLPGTVVGAALDPRGDGLYLAVEGDDLRIVRVPFDGTEPQDLHRERINGRLLLTWDRLHATPDGRRLVLDRCLAESCSWLVLDTETGGTTTLEPDGAGMRVDLSNDTVLTTATSCVTGPCPFVLVDLVTSDTEEFDLGAHEARLALADDGRTVIVYDNQGVPGSDPQLTITAVDPQNGDERVLLQSDATGDGLGLAREGQGSWAPPGWVVLAPPGLNVGEAGGPVLLRLSDGQIVRLPVPGD